MKKTLPILIVFLLASLTWAGISKLQKSKEEFVFKTGDIIYQSSDQGQSKAVKLATHSKYSHVGMVVVTDSGNYVLEAVQPVQYLEIKKWIARDPNKKYCVQRVKETRDFNNNNAALKTKMTTLLGKNYDILFEWSDEKFYCSELVWKVYKEVYGIELSSLKQLKDFDLTHPYVKDMLEQRYGKNLPLEQEVVAPQDLYESVLLQTLVE